MKKEKNGSIFISFRLCKFSGVVRLHGRVVCIVETFSRLYRVKSFFKKDHCPNRPAVLKNHVLLSEGLKFKEIELVTCFVTSHFMPKKDPAVLNFKFSSFCFPQVSPAGVPYQGTGLGMSNVVGYTTGNLCLRVSLSDR